MNSRISSDSWRVLQTLRPNVLVIEPDAQQRPRVLEAVLDGSRTPVWHCTHTTLALPAEAVGTLVVDDVGTLTPEQQRELLVWAETHPGTQIVTVSATPLYPAVEAGTFLDSLYYRLNVLVIDQRDF